MNLNANIRYTGSGQAFTRTAVERVAGLYVSGEAGGMVAVAGRDIALTGALLVNNGNATLPDSN